MTVKHSGIAVGLLVFGFCFWVPQNAYAVALAESNLSFSNLQIISTDPAGTVEPLSPWELESFAEARNSRGDLYQAYISNVNGGKKVEEGTGSASFFVSPDGKAVSADASIPWAAGHGDASAPADPPDFNVTANANSTVDIPDHIKMQWAASDGRGSLINLFTITGGTGSVELGFSVDIAGFLHVLTTNNGILAETETIFTLAVFNLITGDLELLLDDYAHLLVGPNSELSLTVSRTLARTSTLDFDVPYFLYLEVDSESYGVVSEPSILVLLSLGMGILVVSTRNNRETFRAS